MHFCLWLEDTRLVAMPWFCHFYSLHIVPFGFIGTSFILDSLVVLVFYSLRMVGILPYSYVGGSGVFDFFSMWTVTVSCQQLSFSLIVWHHA